MENFVDAVSLGWRMFMSQASVVATQNTLVRMVPFFFFCTFFFPFVLLLPCCKCSYNSPSVFMRESVQLLANS